MDDFGISKCFITQFPLTENVPFKLNEVISGNETALLRFLRKNFPEE